MKMPQYNVTAAQTTPENRPKGLEVKGGTYGVMQTKLNTPYVYQPDTSSIARAGKQFAEGIGAIFKAKEDLYEDSQWLKVHETMSKAYSNIITGNSTVDPTDEEAVSNWLAEIDNSVQDMQANDKEYNRRYATANASIQKKATQLKHEMLNGLIKYKADTQQKIFDTRLDENTNANITDATETFNTIYKQEGNKYNTAQDANARANIAASKNPLKVTKYGSAINATGTAISNSLTSVYQARKNGAINTAKTEERVVSTRKDAFTNMYVTNANNQIDAYLNNGDVAGAEAFYRSVYGGDEYKNYGFVEVYNEDTGFTMVLKFHNSEVKEYNAAHKNEPPLSMDMYLKMKSEELETKGIASGNRVQAGYFTTAELGLVEEIEKARNANMAKIVRAKEARDIKIKIDMPDPNKNAAFDRIGDGPNCTLTEKQFAQLTDTEKKQFFDSRGIVAPARFRKTEKKEKRTSAQGIHNSKSAQQNNAKYYSSLP